MLVILALRRVWQEDFKFKAGLGHKVRLCLKTNRQTSKQTKTKQTHNWRLLAKINASGNCSRLTCSKYTLAWLSTQKCTPHKQNLVQNWRWGEGPFRQKVQHAHQREIFTQNMSREYLRQKENATRRKQICANRRISEMIVMREILLSLKAVKGNVQRIVLNLEKFQRYYKEFLYSHLPISHCLEILHNSGTFSHKHWYVTACICLSLDILYI